MSIFLNLYNKDNVPANISNPWDMDCGQIMYTDTNGGLSYIGSVWKTDGNNNLSFIWPNHNQYRFGLVWVEDMRSGHSIYKDIYANPITRENFYPGNFGQPHPVQGPNSKVLEYTIYTDGDACNLKFYIRSCDYRYKRRLTVSTDPSIVGSFISLIDNPLIENTGIPSPDWNTNDNLSQTSNSITNTTDVMLTFHQTVNPFSHSYRESYVTIYQIDPLTNQPTGESIRIHIIQYPDQIKTVYYNRMTGLKWYADSTGIVEIDEPRISYPVAGAEGEVTTLYFKIVGTATTGSGKRTEVYYMQYPTANNESVDKLRAELTSKSPEHPINIKSLSYIGNGIFAVEVEFGSNHPAPTGNGILTTNDVEIKNINYNEIFGEIQFDILKDLSSEQKFATIGIYLEGIKFNNDKTIYQDGMVVTDNISKLYIKDPSTAITVKCDDPLYESCAITNIGNRVQIQIFLNKTNIPGVVYEFVGMTYDKTTISADGGQILVRYQIKRTGGRTEQRSFRFTVTFKSTKYGDFTDIFNMVQYGHNAEGTQYLAHSVVDARPTVSGFNNLSVSAISTSGQYNQFYINVPANPALTSNVPVLSNIDKYIASGSSKLLTLDDLPGQSSQVGNYYIGFSLTLGHTNSSPRSIYLALNIYSIEGVPQTIVKESTFTQQGSTNATGATYITDATGFVLKNNTDNITSNNNSVYISAYNRYFIPIVANTNTNKSSTTSAGRPYKITDIRNQGWNNTDKAVVTLFKVSQSSSRDILPRLLEFTLSHPLYSSGGIKFSWTQAGITDAENSTSYIIPTSSNINKLSIKNITDDDTKNLLTGLSYSVAGNTGTGDFILYTSGNNTIFRNGRVLLWGQVDDNSSSVQDQTYTVPNTGGSPTIWGWNDWFIYPITALALTPSWEVTFDNDTEGKANISAASIPYTGTSTYEANDGVSFSCPDFPGLTATADGTKAKTTISIPANSNESSSKSYVVTIKNTQNDSIKITFNQGAAEKTDYSFYFSGGTSTITLDHWDHWNYTNPATFVYSIVSKDSKGNDVGFKAEVTSTSGLGSNTVSNSTVAKSDHITEVTTKINNVTVPSSANMEVTVKFTQNTTGSTITAYLKLPYWKANISDGKVTMMGTT